MDVHAEAGYYDGECRRGNQQEYCDLAVSSGENNETWIELAIGSHHNNPENRRVLRNKPGKIEKWENDASRLIESAPRSAQKLFLVLGLFDGNPNSEDIGGRLKNLIANFYPEGRFANVGPFQLSWGETKMYGKFWAWEW